MKRIAVLGSPGSGKSRFAILLGANTGLPVIHLDQLFWRPGWRPAPMAEYRARHDAAVAADAWIIDGDYSRHFGARLRRAEGVVLFEVPTSVALTRVLRRAVFQRGQVRADMAAGCPERFDFSFLLWVLNFRRRRLPHIRQAVAREASAAAVFVVGSKRDAQTLLASISAQAQTVPANRAAP